MDETRIREEGRAAKKAAQEDDVFALIEARYSGGKVAEPSTGPALDEGSDCGCDCGGEDAASDASGEAGGASSCCG